ncbi:CAP-Gly domain-containing linker protein 4 [Astathelohania contejeani]|uniref:CAP-Gly domain-containing linker protein 4 n=1 Tax=Astathelohania contejeani TaxID=164912 RepID=A0ABQ7I2I0_9MICR|nr:CAP-Gly domain-containing linker protein 4 [Thelohania contejeani]
MVFKLNEKVVFKDKGAGIIKYIGPIEGKKGIFMGIDMEKPLGKNNGCIGDKEYFQCSGDNHGVFIKYERALQLFNLEKEEKEDDIDLLVKKYQMPSLNRNGRRNDNTKNKSAINNDAKSNKKENNDKNADDISKEYLIHLESENKELKIKLLEVNKRIIDIGVQIKNIQEMLDTLVVPHPCKISNNTEERMRVLFLLEKLACPATPNYKEYLKEFDEIVSRAGIK